MTAAARLYSVDELTPLIRDWSVNTRLPEVRQEIVRRYYYRAIIERTKESRLAEMELCRRDPVHWFNTWVWTYDPRGMSYGLPANIPFVLRPKQTELVGWLLERLESQTGGLIEKSRDEGMSYVVLGFFLHQWLFIDGFAAGVGSRKEEYVDEKGSPKTLLHKFRDMLGKLPTWMHPAGFSERTHDNYMRIINPANGASITGEAGDNIGRGGRTTIYLLDEWAFVQRQDKVDAAISQNTNVILKGSTPNGIGDRFYQDRFSGRYPVFTMPWRDNPDKNWTAKVDGQLIHPWYEKQRATLDDVVLAQEVDINYAASVEGVLIPSAWVQAAIDAHIKLGIEPTGQRIAALDVADEGKDLNSFTGRHGVVMTALKSWSGKGDDIFGTTQTALDECVDGEYSTMYYDADGLGAGVRGDARVINERHTKQGRAVIKVDPFAGSAAVFEPEKEMVKGRKNKDFFANLKAQSWWSLRMRFQNTFRAINGIEYDPEMIISIPSDLSERAQLMVELSQPTYTKNGSGKIVVDKQPDGSKSPNRADAVMICYSPLVRRPQAPATGGNRTF